MMKHLFKRTVLLLNSMDKIDYLLAKAVEFSNRHNTTLEILYVLEEELFDLPDYFLSDEKIAEERIDKKKIKAKVQGHLHAFGEAKKAAIFVYVNDSVERVLHHGLEHKEVLFITPYHEALSRALLNKTPYSFWIIKNEGKTYNNIVLPLDLKGRGKEVIHATQHIFEKSHLTLVHDYRYLVDTTAIQVDYLETVPIITPEMIEINKIRKKEQKEIFEALKKEFSVEGVFFEDDEALDDTLMKFIEEHKCDLTVLYHQDTELFLSPTLILELLKKVSTDFFIFNL